MTSDTSAYFSSQSENSETITAGIWEVPQVFVNACGQEYIIDEVTGEIVYLDLEIKNYSPIEKSETDVLSSGEEEINSEAKDDTPIEESKVDVISSGENEVDSEAKNETPREESETDVISSGEEEIDQEAKDETPTEEKEKGVISNGVEMIDCEDIDGLNTAGELGCEGKEGSPIEESGTASGEENMADCTNNEEPLEESEIAAPENIETIEPKNEEQKELENGNGEGEKERDTKTDVEDSKEKEPQKSNDESQKQPDGKDASVTESKEKNPTDKDSTKDEATENRMDQNKAEEINDAVKQEENIQKAEDGTNEV